MDYRVGIYDRSVLRCNHCVEMPAGQLQQALCYTREGHICGRGTQLLISYMKVEHVKVEA